MANLIGQPAPLLEMTGTNEKPVSLYDVPADFLVVIFWDPTCSHCKENRSQSGFDLPGEMEG